MMWTLGVRALRRGNTFRWFGVVPCMAISPVANDRPSWEPVAVVRTVVGG